jgi:NADPH-dependent ferric siderophore reductase
MSVLSKTLGAVLEKTLMAPAKIVSVKALGRFRLIELRGEGLKKSGWEPGDKLRVKLGDLDLRTYTPTAWDDAKGVTKLLAWLPGRGPGSAWANAAKAGESFHFKGPKESLKLSKAAEGPVVFFGDETAVGAAAALRGLRPGDRSVRFFFELSDPAGAGAALSAVGLEDAVVVKREDDGSHLKPLRRKIVECVEAWTEEGRVFLVGNQESLKELKSGIGKKVGDKAKVKTKVYWREGKKGLD